MGLDMTCFQFLNFFIDLSQSITSFLTSTTLERPFFIRQALFDATMTSESAREIAAMCSSRGVIFESCKGRNPSRVVCPHFWELELHARSAKNDRLPAFYNDPELSCQDVPDLCVVGR